MMKMAHRWLFVVAVFANESLLAVPLFGVPSIHRERVYRSVRAIFAAEISNG
jgi:hypothetical protein